MKPIAFSRPMVLARRDGRKTQTRRLLKPQPKPNQVFMSDVDRDGKAFAYFDGGQNALVLDPPYGQPGEQLWVREDFTILTFGRKRSNGSPFCSVQYKADGERRLELPITEHECGLLYGRKFPLRATPGRFMYQSLARDKPTLLAVRVERLQDITEEDALAEGCEYRSNDDNTHMRLGSGPDSWDEKGKGYFTPGLNHRNTFRHLWGSIHGPESWAANPYVWVLTLSKFQPA